MGCVPGPVSGGALEPGSRGQWLLLALGSPASPVAGPSSGAGMERRAAGRTGGRPGGRGPGAGSAAAGLGARWGPGPAPRAPSAGQDGGRGAWGPGPAGGGGDQGAEEPGGHSGGGAAAAPGAVSAAAGPAGGRPARPHLDPAAPTLSEGPAVAGPGLRGQRPRRWPQVHGGAAPGLQAWPVPALDRARPLGHQQRDRPGQPLGTGHVQAVARGLCGWSEDSEVCVDTSVRRPPRGAQLTPSLCHPLSFVLAATPPGWAWAWCLRGRWERGGAMPG